MRAFLAILIMAMPWPRSAWGQVATRVTVAALPTATTSGRGATPPCDEMEAENAVGNGKLIGPDRRFTSIAAEASGRRAVELTGVGRFVAFTLAHAADAGTVRAMGGPITSSMKHACISDGRCRPARRCGWRSRRATAPWYVIDLADFEQVPPARSRPTDALSVVSFGANASVNLHVCA